MKLWKSAVVAATAVMMAGGCASSGGGHEGASSTTGSTINGKPVTLQQALVCLLSYGFACPRVDSESAQEETRTAPWETRTAAWVDEPAVQGPLQFTRWQDADPDKEVSVRGSQAQASFTYSGAGGAVEPATTPSAGGNGAATVTYAESGALKEFYSGRGFTPGIVAKGFNGGREVDVVWAGQTPTESAFTLESRDVALVANPYQLGWDYQSFGAWSDTSFARVSAKALSFGATTPGAAVPATGSATFVGKLAGMYVSPAGTGSTVGANLSVSANFSERSLSFSSDKTIVTRSPQGGSTETMSQLNLSGTLTYAPMASTFSGTLVNAGGTMSGTSSGRFYGPAAQELGGVFALKSPTTVETFVGAYGAKR